MLGHLHYCWVFACSGAFWVGLGEIWVILGNFGLFWGILGKFGYFEPFGALLTGLGHYELFWGIWDRFGVTSKGQFGGLCIISTEVL